MTLTIAEVKEKLSGVEVVEFCSQNRYLIICNPEMVAKAEVMAMLQQLKEYGIAACAIGVLDTAEAIRVLELIP